MWHTMCGILWNVLAAMIFIMTFFTIHAERNFFINYDGYSWGAFGAAFFCGEIIHWLANEFLYIFGVFRLVFDIILCDIGCNLLFLWDAIIFVE